MSPHLWVSSILPYTLLLPLKVVPSLHNAPSPSPISHTVVLLPLLFSSLSFPDTPTSCVPPFHTESISLFTPLLSVYLPPLCHTASLNPLISQTYFLPLFSFSVLLCFYSSGRGIRTYHITYIASLLSLPTLPLIWQGHAFGWACRSWVCCMLLRT